MWAAPPCSLELNEPEPEFTFLPPDGRQWYGLTLPPSQLPATVDVSLTL